MGQLTNTRNSSLTVVEAGKATVTVLADLVSGAGPLPDSHCVFMGKKE